MAVQFTQSCPTCGRRLQVQARLFGKRVACQHCHAEFTAGASDSASGSSPYDLLARAEAMLGRTEVVSSGSQRLLLDQEWFQSTEFTQVKSGSANAS